MFLFFFFSFSIFVQETNNAQGWLCRGSDGSNNKIFEGQQLEDSWYGLII